MKINDWLKTAVDALSQTQIESARLDALILLEDAIGQDRAWLLANPEESISSEQLHVLAERLERRLQHQPLAYIRGHAEFYGRRFVVSEDVLIPRPETEDMIDLLLAFTEDGDRIVDIGTGSGALAITAALETGASVIATDISNDCLAVARLNAEHLAAAVTCLSGDLLVPFINEQSTIDPNIVLANLPYVPDEYTINDAAKHEPGLALFGGSDGLDLYRQLFSQAATLAKPPRLILTEALDFQHQSLADIATNCGYSLQQSQGLIQVFTRRP